MPETYLGSDDTINIASLKWKQFFNDSNLIALIDSALQNNQELNIVKQEIEISKNEVMARKGEYLPFVNLYKGLGIEKPARYTFNGAVEKSLEPNTDLALPRPLKDFATSANATWEIDIWEKLRNAKKAAVKKYLASMESKNFLITNLIAEIAYSYYELIAYDNLLEIIEKNIQIQSNALKVVMQEKESAKVSQLAVNRFEAQLLNTKNLQYAIKQKIVETENRLNNLTGRFPDKIGRKSDVFLSLKIDSLLFGVPSQLLTNRPDIKRAELELQAAKLDVKVARANFYPRLGITATTGFKAFNPVFLTNPESVTYNLAGDLVAPFINRNAIRAAYNTAKAKELQAIYNYERTLINAYTDVLNQVYKINNYANSYETKNREVEILTQSVDIAGKLFYSARADYAEVLLTQRESLNAKMELIEIKMQLLNAKVNIYRALGGGWQ
ncbi:MAG: TolC family protein [Bacteroidia bacterium]